MRYDKLIRDKIPQQLDQKGVRHTVHRAVNGEYEAKLREKLDEEVREYLTPKNGSHDPGELADILEVVYALGELHEISEEDLELMRHRKADLNGRFKKRLILEEAG